MRFDSYHPAINLIYFASVLAATIGIRHPVWLAISFCCALAYSTKLNGLRGLMFGLCTLPAAGLYALWYGGYHHFGATALRLNFIGNRITLESLVYGLVLGGTVAAVLVWFSCIHAVFSADKVVYLFGRVSPHLALFLSILLRMVPRIKAQAKRIHTAQRAIGRGIGQGNLFRRIHNLLRVISILVTWLSESFVTSAESMRSRGFALKGRTAFSIYRFDNRDRSLVIVLFTCLTLLGAAILLQQTWALYDPRLLISPVTPLSLAFYLGYAVFCLLPLGLQLVGEWQFRHLRGTVS